VLPLLIIEKGTKGSISQAAFAFSVYCGVMDIGMSFFVLFGVFCLLQVCVLTGEWVDG